MRAGRLCLLPLLAALGGCVLVRDRSPRVLQAVRAGDGSIHLRVKYGLDAPCEEHFVVRLPGASDPAAPPLRPTAADPWPYAPSREWPSPGREDSRVPWILGDEDPELPPGTPLTVVDHPGTGGPGPSIRFDRGLVVLEDDRGSRPIAMFEWLVVPLPGHNLPEDHPPDPR